MSERIWVGRFQQWLMKREEEIMPYDVQVKELPAQPVVRKREKVTLADIGEVIGRDIGELFGFAGRKGVAPAGPPFVAYEGELPPDRDVPIEIEIGLPVAKLVEGEGDVEAAELPAGPVAWTVHRGPYDEIRSAYQAVFGWIAEHGHETAGPVREVYMTAPSETADPAGNITELHWPIR